MNNHELQVLRSLVSEEQYNNIKALLDGTKDPMTYPFVANWYNESLAATILPMNDLVLAACDIELKTQGIEHIFDEDSKKVFSYCNCGDEFGLTIMYHHDSKKYIYSSFINIIEALDENMLEIFLND